MSTKLPKTRACFVTIQSMLPFYEFYFSHFADGVMTSYQMKTTTPVTLATDKPEVKDPFSDLDPLWKLKSKN